MSEELTIKDLVFQSLGEASMCWNTTPTGVFDDTRAKEIGERLLAVIEQRTIEIRRRGKAKPTTGLEEL